MILALVALAASSLISTSAAGATSEVQDQALGGNLGAVPAYLAITAAKDEIGDDALSLIWLDARIIAQNGGWCVALTGINRHDGSKHEFPVFVEQNGRAWRTDPAADLIYDGGADGLYMPPRWAADCTLAVPPPLPPR